MSTLKPMISSLEPRAREAVPALAPEFCTLTAARTGEVLGAVWDEIDAKRKA